jgi:hypothetical protein
MIRQLNQPRIISRLNSPLQTVLTDKAIAARPRPTSPFLTTRGFPNPAMKRLAVNAEK